MENPDVPFGIGIDRDHRSPLHARGKLRPTLNDTVRIVLCARGHCRDDDRRDDGCDTRESPCTWVCHPTASSDYRSCSVPAKPPTNITFSTLHSHSRILLSR